jgi:hypothetical protein
MPPVDPESTLGRATLALIAHERTGNKEPLPGRLEFAFQCVQLERAKMVLAAASPVLTADLVVSASALLSNADPSEDEPGVSLVMTGDLEALRAAVARVVEEQKP